MPIVLDHGRGTFNHVQLVDVLRAIPGCVALWPCNDRSGVIRDIVGGGGSGTAAGGTTYGSPTIVPGDGASSLAFDGAVGSQVSGTGTNLPLGDNTVNWTILAWLYSSATFTASTTFFGYGGSVGGGVRKGRRLIRFNSHIYFWGDNADLDSTVDYTVGRPQLIAASNSGGTVTTSKDGVLVATGSPTPSSFVTPDSQIWGMSKKEGTFEVTMNGSISHFAIFNRAVTLNELRYAAYMAGAG